MSEAAASYNGTDRANHWIVALAILSLLAVGWVLYFEALLQETAKGVRDLHKAFGTIVLVFAFWRVGYRLARGFPSPASPMSRWQYQLSQIVHFGLLALIVVMPASGFFKSFFAGRSIDMFGLFTIGSPDLKNEAIAELSSAAHFFAGIAITAMVVLHITAALKHHFVDRDSTLNRMLRG